MLACNFCTVVCSIPEEEVEVWLKGDRNGLSKRMESGYSTQIKYNPRWNCRRECLRPSKVFSFTSCAREEAEVSSEYRQPVMFVKFSITNLLQGGNSRHCLFMVYLKLFLPFKLFFSLPRKSHFIYEKSDAPNDSVFLALTCLRT